MTNYLTDDEIKKGIDEIYGNTDMSDFYDKCSKLTSAGKVFSTDIAAGMYIDFEVSGEKIRLVRGNYTNRDSSYVCAMGETDCFKMSRDRLGNISSGHMSEGLALKVMQFGDLENDN